jgi:hypothetical protein
MYPLVLFIKFSNNVDVPSLINPFTRESCMFVTILRKCLPPPPLPLLYLPNVRKHAKNQCFKGMKPKKVYNVTVKTMILCTVHFKLNHRGLSYDKLMLTQSTLHTYTRIVLKQYQFTLLNTSLFINYFLLYSWRKTPIKIACLDCIKNLQNQSVPLSNSKHDNINPNLACPYKAREHGNIK